MILRPTIAVLLASLANPAVAADDPRDQFDFWLGGWDVTNRHFRGGSWVQSGTSRAVITPVLGGDAVLEQWDGRTGAMSGVFGFSLRWYDAELERWVVILNWPGGSVESPRFGRMEGAFEDGVCHLFPPNTFVGPGVERARDATRYTFSHATAESCRWTQSTPGGRGAWNESWIMDFARTEPAMPDGTPLEINEPPEACACDSEGARALDNLVGAWADDGVTVRVSSAIRGCLLFIAVDGGDADRFIALSYASADDTWSAFSLDSDLADASWSGRADASGIVLRSTARSDASRRGETLRISAEDGGFRLAIESADGVVLDADLARQ
ncbi:MAG: hypothetical protein RIB60_10810 [Phycisphaerales bacterium]